ncbi:Rho GTPase-activating protein 27 [Hondaea fermentalgiana]|uniref:Rho GTPase-activating protein 27 n=1 Tax=Hondaea fermentalgiana TaxID=2315210 RepID=A0A2R5GJX4_9STRA|nr:Rho GTPase-activating protein 27 [Hondaea fermentalgiana]|eukprot:GBG28943.1 Rho GTPase-activating protein 27 [Hondaea fermentalgiana]
MSDARTGAGTGATAGASAGKKAQKLGNGWYAAYSAKHGRLYYFNTATKQRQWTEPDEVKIKFPPRKQDDAQTSSPSSAEKGANAKNTTSPHSAGSHTSGNSAGSTSPGRNWTKHWDEKRKRHYYFNKRTGQSSWENPELIRAHNNDIRAQIFDNIDANPAPPPTTPSPTSTPKEAHPTSNGHSATTQANDHQDDSREPGEDDFRSPANTPPGAAVSGPGGASKHQQSLEETVHQVTITTRTATRTTTESTDAEDDRNETQERAESPHPDDADLRGAVARALISRDSSRSFRATSDDSGYYAVESEVEDANDVREDAQAVHTDHEENTDDDEIVEQAGHSQDEESHPSHRDEKAGSSDVEIESSSSAHGSSRQAAQSVDGSSASENEISYHNHEQDQTPGEASRSARQDSADDSQAQDSELDSDSDLHQSSAASEVSVLQDIRDPRRSSYENGKRHLRADDLLSDSEDEKSSSPDHRDASGSTGEDVAPVHAGRSSSTDDAKEIAEVAKERQVQGNDDDDVSNNDTPSEQSEVDLDQDGERLAVDLDQVGGHLEVDLDKDGEHSEADLDQDSEQSEHSEIDDERTSDDAHHADDDDNDAHSDDADAHGDSDAHGNDEDAQSEESSQNDSLNEDARMGHSEDDNSGASQSSENEQMSEALSPRASIDAVSRRRMGSEVGMYNEDHDPGNESEEGDEADEDADETEDEDTQDIDLAQGGGDKEDVEDARPTEPNRDDSAEAKQHNNSRQKNRERRKSLIMLEGAELAAESSDEEDAKDAPQKQGSDDCDAKDTASNSSQAALSSDEIDDAQPDDDRSISVATVTNEEDLEVTAEARMRSTSLSFRHTVHRFSTSLEERNHNHNMDTDAASHSSGGWSADEGDADNQDAQDDAAMRRPNNEVADIKDQASRKANGAPNALHVDTGKDGANEGDEASSSFSPSFRMDKNGELLVSLYENEDDKSAQWLSLESDECKALADEQDTAFDDEFTSMLEFREPEKAWIKDLEDQDCYLDLVESLIEETIKKSNADS